MRTLFFITCIFLIADRIADEALAQQTKASRSDFVSETSQARG